MAFTEILLGLLVVVTHFIEAVTGFGSAVLALPFAASLTGVAAAVPLLSFHSWLFAAWVVAADFKKIMWRQYCTAMLFVLMGLPLGMWAYTVLPETVLKLILAAFMLAVSVNGTIRHFHRPAGEAESDISPLRTRKWRAVLYVLLFLGGVIHGAFATGGPLLMIYTTLTIKEKGSFRATMCAIWFSLNAIVLARFLLTGAFTPEVTRLSLVTLPFLLAGVLLGAWAHKRIPDRYFARVVYIVLFLSGCFLAYPAISALLR
ncbi:MAG: sulfite exporter TauE/SafE family protein [Oscillospiraceae bacterium]|jgi:uncharacterized membrane protein YfcA|nr:sulfite exporter TauE/SafE family protein [Oscillospiraceae bacterium]